MCEGASLLLKYLFFDPPIFMKHIEIKISNVTASSMNDHICELVGNM
jgi:hypothetical protein